MLEQSLIKIGVLAETCRGERRVALVPDVAAKLARTGFEMVIEAGAGVQASFSDDAYRDVGVTLEADRRMVLEVSRKAFLRVPVKLAPYHKEVLKDRSLNTSTTLHKRHGVWWLTLSYDQDVPVQTKSEAPVVGVDVGIVHFLTTSTGKEYGSFHGKMARRHKRDRAKRRRKAKLRACLEKKGMPREQLPSTSSVSGQRLSRHVRQEINRAVNELIKDHPDARLIYEELSVASMRFHARAMNAYLYASQLGHIPEQLAWAAKRQCMAAHPVRAAYSSQECPLCHFVDRANRPNQRTFKCVVCGYADYADHKAAGTLAGRWGDRELA